MSEETTTATISRPWDFHKKFDTYPEADSARKKLLKKDKKIEVRVRRRSDDTYDIKTRSVPKK
tara:strand:+ start:2111 stop:2299 length:189 start_codon:yes stop_codon:yes gene_type:complete